MSKNRWVNTRFWEDNYIMDLDPSEKYIFLYCLTNDSTSLCGAYEINLKTVALQTGYDKEMLLKIFGRFQKDDKIAYIDGYIVVRNFRKHQADNKNIQLGIAREESMLPEHIKDSLYIGFQSLSKDSNTLPILNLTLPIPNGYVAEATQDLHEMRELWKTYAGTTLRNHVEENLKDYRYLKRELEDELPLYLQAVRMIRADQFARRALQDKLVNFVGLRKCLEEVEGYMQGKVDSRVTQPVILEAS